MKYVQGWNLNLTESPLENLTVLLWKNDAKCQSRSAFLLITRVQGFSEVAQEFLVSEWLVRGRYKHAAILNVTFSVFHLAELFPPVLWLWRTRLGKALWASVIVKDVIYFCAAVSSRQPFHPVDTYNANVQVNSHSCEEFMIVLLFKKAFFSRILRLLLFAVLSI